MGRFRTWRHVDPLCLNFKSLLRLEPGKKHDSRTRGSPSLTAMWSGLPNSYSILSRPRKIKGMHPGIPTWKKKKSISPKTTRPGTGPSEKRCRVQLLAVRLFLSQVHTSNAYLSAYSLSLLSSPNQFLYVPPSFLLLFPQGCNLRKPDLWDSILAGFEVWFWSAHPKILIQYAILGNKLQYHGSDTGVTL